MIWYIYCDHNEEVTLLISQILNISPSTGYDIKKYCDTVISGFWNENFGHIYPTLKVLEEEGCIQQISEETPTQPVRSEFMLKFLFSSQIPAEQVIEMLDRYKKRLEKELKEYQIMEKELEQGIKAISESRTRFLKATLRRGILASQASIMWCEETILELKK